MQIFTNQLSDRLTVELAIARKLKVRPVTVSDRDFEAVVNSGTVKWAVTQERELLIVPKYVRSYKVIKLPHTTNRKFHGFKFNWLIIGINF